MSIMFMSDLWQPPEGYEPAEITHEDPQIMAMVRAMMDADPECQGYEYNVEGATQGKLYYEIPYRDTIQHYIQLAIAAKAALEEGREIP